MHLYTGFGKTVLALWLVACLQPLQTVVYVHKHSLALQWDASIKQFLSVELGENVVVRTVQGQLNRLEEMHEMTPGALVIFDEVHHMCAHSFSQLLFHSHAQWHLGLSATEKRKDGLHAALHCLLGRPCVSITALRHKPLVYRSFFKGPQGLYNFRTQRVRGREVVNFPHAVSMLCECPERNQHIMDILRQLRSRNVLVLSHRRSHASVLADMATGLATDLGDVDVRLLLGQMKDSEIRSATAPAQKAAASIILVATAQAAGEGFDMPILDTVLFATPASDVSQETGRVLRCAGSNRPLVIDIVDGAGVYMALYRKRKVFYDSQNLEFTDHFPGGPGSPAARR